MAVKWDSQPLAMTVDAQSAHDYRIGQSGQKYYGLVNLQTGTIYLVAGGPVIPARSFFMSLNPGFGKAPILDTYGGQGQGGHGVVAYLYGLNRQRGWTENHAGFSVTKREGGYREIKFRSGLNRSCFDDRPENEDDPDDQIDRAMPGSWAGAIAMTLETAFS
jgi:hypothetical protein